MSNQHDKTSGPDRRASVRVSRRVSQFSAGSDDDYDLQAMGIADGFRPADVAQNHGLYPTSTSTSMGTTSSATGAASTSATSQSTRPSSIAKPHRPTESLSLQNEGPRESSGTSAPTRMASTSTSISPLARPESPYSGPSGPSFPYQMYPQNVRVARTASVATASTAQASDHGYAGPHGPTHPYAMYSQSTVPIADDAEDRITPAPIPVGFPGTRDNYQRRLGPDGEDAADIIGPDGHTEQLPPYSKYPEEAYARKAQGIVPPQTGAGPVRAVPGAGGIGLATRNPEFESREDLHATSPQSRHSLRSFQTDVSHHDINTAAAGVVSEKKPLKNWQKVAKRKIWGVVPCWALTLTLIILVMLAVVLGAILGTFLSKKKGPAPPSSSGQSKGGMATIDAVPWPTVPPGLPPLAEGVFAIPLSVTREPRTCFGDTRQAQAWNCNIVFSQMFMSINKLPDAPATNQYCMSLQYNDSFTLDQSVYSYGMQPPSFSDAQLTLVNDTFELSRGPAWAFNIVYNKTIIIPEPFLSPSSLKDRRGEFGDMKRKSVAVIGEKPWVCRWDYTILETFIFATQNTSRGPIVMNGNPSSSSASSSVTPGPAANIGLATPYWKARRDAEKGTQSYTSYDKGTPTRTSSSSTTSTLTSNFFDNGPEPTNTRLPMYPRVVKMEERRIIDDATPSPWCRQYEILPQGARPYKDANGNHVDVLIEEKESGSSHAKIRRSDIEWFLGHGLEERGTVNDMSDCGCMWWNI